MSKHCIAGARSVVPAARNRAALRVTGVAALLAATLLTATRGDAGASDSASSSASPTWLIGQWILAEDEDGGPPGMDLDEFFEDGRYLIYGPNCREPKPMAWHIYRGDVYVTGEVPGKGPIAMIFRPNADHSELTFTSPRTRNNAVYRRAPANACSRIEK